MENKIVVFENKEIRCIWYEEAWYFSVVDIIAALTDSPKPRVYWGVLKSRETQLFTICKQLKMLKKGHELHEFTQIIRANSCPFSDYSSSLSAPTVSFIKYAFKNGVKSPFKTKSVWLV